MRGTSDARSPCQICSATNKTAATTDTTKQAITAPESHARLAPAHCVTRKKQIMLTSARATPRRSSCSRISDHGAGTGLAAAGGLNDRRMSKRLAPPMGRLI